MLDARLPVQPFVVDAAARVQGRYESFKGIPKHSIKVLTDDYRHMQNMIFGDKPAFEEILYGIGKLEAEIHAL